MSKGVLLRGVDPEIKRRCEELTSDPVAMAELRAAVHEIAVKAQQREDRMRRDQSIFARPHVDLNGFGQVNASVKTAIDFAHDKFFG